MQIVADATKSKLESSKFGHVVESNAKENKPGNIDVIFAFPINQQFPNHYPIPSYIYMKIHRMASVASSQCMTASSYLRRRLSPIALDFRVTCGWADRLSISCTPKIGPRSPARSHPVWSCRSRTVVMASASRKRATRCTFCCAAIVACRRRALASRASRCRTSRSSWCSASAMRPTMQSLQPRLRPACCW